MHAPAATCHSTMICSTCYNSHFVTCMLPLLLATVLWSAQRVTTHTLLHACSRCYLPQYYDLLNVLQLTLCYMQYMHAPAATCHSTMFCTWNKLDWIYLAEACQARRTPTYPHSWCAVPSRANQSPTLLHAYNGNSTSERCNTTAPWCLVTEASTPLSQVTASDCYWCIDKLCFIILWCFI